MMIFAPVRLFVVSLLLFLSVPITVYGVSSEPGGASPFEVQSSQSDYGLLAPIANPLRDGVVYIGNRAGSVALGVIAMTLLLKLLTLPLLYLSLKSGKAMRLIQPEIKKLKETYAKEPLQLQRAMQDLFREKELNPLLSMLPLFSQIPLFLAFYQVVLGIEKVLGAESFLWLTSLSVPDPVYIIPLLIGLVLYVNQRYSSATAELDPQVKRVTVIALPAVATVFGILMPAGVALYMLTSSFVQCVGQLCLQKVV